jgi:hypothetical protein
LALNNWPSISRNRRVDSNGRKTLALMLPDGEPPPTRTRGAVLEVRKHYRSRILYWVLHAYLHAQGIDFLQVFVENEVEVSS